MDSRGFGNLKNLQDFIFNEKGVGIEVPRPKTTKPNIPQ